MFLVFGPVTGKVSARAVENEFQINAVESGRRYQSAMGEGVAVITLSHSKLRLSCGCAV